MTLPFEKQKSAIDMFVCGNKLCYASQFGLMSGKAECFLPGKQENTFDSTSCCKTSLWSFFEDFVVWWMESAWMPADLSKSSQAVLIPSKDLPDWTIACYVMWAPTPMIISLSSWLRCSICKSTRMLFPAPPWPLTILLQTICCVTWRGATSTIRAGVLNALRAYL